MKVVCRKCCLIEKNQLNAKRYDGALWNPMKINGRQWDSEEFQENSMEFLDSHYNPHSLTEFQHILWNSLLCIEIDGIPWNPIRLHGIPWNTIGFDDFPLNYMKLLQRPQISMGFHELNGLP